MITNFDNEMIALYRQSKDGNYADVALESGVGKASRNSLGFGCCSSMPTWTAGSTCWRSTVTSTKPCVTFESNVGYAQPPHLFLNQRQGRLSRCSR